MTTRCGRTLARAPSPPRARAARPALPGAAIDQLSARAPASAQIHKEIIEKFKTEDVAIVLAKAGASDDDAWTLDEGATLTEGLVALQQMGDTRSWRLCAHWKGERLEVGFDPRHRLPPGAVETFAAGRRHVLLLPLQLEAAGGTAAGLLMSFGQEDQRDRLSFWLQQMVGTRAACGATGRGGRAKRPRTLDPRAAVAAAGRGEGGC